MTTKGLLLIIVTIGFAVLTAIAVRDHGVLGIPAFHLTSTAGMQVITDLVIACVLLICWMIADARREGRTAWPFVVLTLTLGSFGPLLYFLVGEFAKPKR